MRVMPQSSHCSTWPPSAAVRQASIAAMTRRSTRPRWPAWVCAERGAVAAEDIRHLQCGAMTLGSAGRHDLEAEPVERARRVADRVGGDLGVARRRRQAGVAEQDLDDADVGPALEQMGGEAVAQRVHGHRLGQARRRAADRQAACRTWRCDRPLVVAAGKQPLRRPRQPPIGPQDRSSCGDSMT